MGVSRKLENTLKELLDLENDRPYIKAKDIVKRRDKLRDETKKLVKSGKELPSICDYAAGIVEVKSRTDWHAVADELRDTYDISDTQYDQVIENHTRKRERLYYGTAELMQQKQLQFEFEIYTPKL